jgi:hypothetical protein
MLVHVLLKKSEIEIKCKYNTQLQLNLPRQENKASFLFLTESEITLKYINWILS